MSAGDYTRRSTGPSSTVRVPPVRKFGSSPMMSRAHLEHDGAAAGGGRLLGLERPRLAEAERRGGARGSMGEPGSEAQGAHGGCHRSAARRYNRSALACSRPTGRSHRLARPHLLAAALRLVVTLLTLVTLPVVIGSSVLIYYYLRYSVMVDRRLHGERWMVPARLYARPLVAARRACRWTAARWSTS